jgi:hypothetical protein
MKIVIPEHLKGKELYKFLIANKDALIRQKKSMQKRTEPVFSETLFINTLPTEATKAAGAVTKEADPNSLHVKVVANTAMYCDTQMDVLLPDSAKRSIKERKGLIPHLHDHIWELDAEVGDVKDIYYQDIALNLLGVNKTGTAQALIFETDIKKAYNERVFQKYKDGKVKQHSIGLQYVKIELAINDPESEKEFDFWNKYINDVINKEVPEAAGYFWVVSEYKLLENSAVLFGSNFLTPTLEVEDKSEDDDTTPQPPIGTEQKPSNEKSESDKSKTESKEVNWDKVASKFL